MPKPPRQVLKNQPPKPLDPPDTESPDPILLARAMLAKRRLEDPAIHFVPTPTQRAFIHRKTRYNLLGGPTRGGKTSCNAMDLALIARRKHPTKTVTCVNGVYMVFGTSREAIRDNWYGKLRVESKLLGPAEACPMIPDHEVLAEKFSGGGGDRTIKEIHLRHPDNPNEMGHRIIFNVSGDVGTWKRMEGKDRVLGVKFDEVAGSKELFTECFRRVLETNSHPGIKEQAGGAFIDWSATETKGNEVFSEWHEKANSPEFPEYAIFVLDPTENKAIDMGERQKMAQNMSAEDYQISMMGKGRFADRLLIYGGQLDYDRHVRKDEYQVTPDDNLWVGYDPGFDHDSGIGVFAINKANPYKLRMVKEWLHPRTTMAQDVWLLAQWLRGRFLECFVADPASHKTEKGSGKKLITQIREELQRAGIKVMRGLRMPYNSHAPGIYAVRRYLDPIPGNPQAEPLVEFSPSCKRTWTQLNNYRSYAEGEFTGQHGVVKKNDEMPDLLRYVVNVTGRSPWANTDAPTVVRPCWVKRPPNLPKYPEGAAPIIKPAEEDILSPEQEILKEQRRLSALSAKLRASKRQKRRNRFVGVSHDTWDDE